LRVADREQYRRRAAPADCRMGSAPTPLSAAS
jgi:hypothetical protein